MSELDPELVRAELERMRQLIATDPAVRAHFDTDGDGVIDSEEWERVRQLVIRRMERKKAEGDEAARLQEEYRQRLADEGPASGERDFSDLELAFDPRAQPRGEVAETIYRRDLQNEFEPIRHVGEDQTLAAHPELVLEQGGGLKRLFGSMFRRHFDIKLPSGEVVGHIAQRENEMVENFVGGSVFDLPDLEFVVEDYVCDETFTLRRSRSFSDNSISVMNARGRTIATTSWTLSLFRRTYEVRVPSEGISYYARRRLLNPWTYDALNAFEDPIGELQRGWSGLAFLTGANTFHIGFDEPVSARAMWGFIAAALLADLDAEPNSRGSFLS